MKKKKQYKALMLDLDGTTIPVDDREGRPSPKVLQALKKASKKIKIGIITARPYWLSEYIFDVLPLSAPCVIASAAKIIDPSTKKILLKQTIEKNDLIATVNFLLRKNLHVNVDMHSQKQSLFSEAIIPEEPVDALFVADMLPQKEADILIEKILQRPTLSAHKMPTPEKGKFWITINHASATKQHGILQVAELLGITTNDIIGVGDGYNDMPLLMSSGLGVAMGNAPEELKAIADYVAPSFDEDGVADVIEKFIL